MARAFARRRRTSQNEGNLYKIGGGNSSFANGGASPLNNTGTVNVQNGTLTVDGGCTQVSGSTLTGGTWKVSNASTLSISGESLATIGPAASVTLDGLASSFAPITPLATVNGHLTLTGGRPFHDRWRPDEQDGGTIHVGPGSTLGVAGPFRSLAACSKLRLPVQLPRLISGRSPRPASHAQWHAHREPDRRVRPKLHRQFSGRNGRIRSGTFSSFTGGTTPSNRLLRDHTPPPAHRLGPPAGPSAADLDAASDAESCQPTTSPTTTRRRSAGPQLILGRPTFTPTASSSAAPLWLPGTGA